MGDTRVKGCMTRRLLVEKINFLPYFILGDNVENPNVLQSRIGCHLVAELLYTGSDLWVLRGVGQ